MLSLKNIAWRYLPGNSFFKLPNGEKYTPDFLLIDERIYIELVGSRQAFHANKNKYDEFIKAYPSKHFRIVKSNGDIIKDYPPREGEDFVPPKLEKKKYVYTGVKRFAINIRCANKDEFEDFHSEAKKMNLTLATYLRHLHLNHKHGTRR